MAVRNWFSLKSLSCILAPPIKGLTAESFLITVIPPGVILTLPITPSSCTSSGGSIAFDHALSPSSTALFNVLISGKAL